MILHLGIYAITIAALASANPLYLPPSQSLINTTQIITNHTFNSHVPRPPDPSDYRHEDFHFTVELYGYGADLSADEIWELLGVCISAANKTVNDRWIHQDPISAEELKYSFGGLALFLYPRAPFLTWQTWYYFLCMMAADMIHVARWETQFIVVLDWVEGEAGWGAVKRVP